MLRIHALQKMHALPHMQIIDLKQTQQCDGHMSHQVKAVHRRDRAREGNQKLE
jgi:hypothetical protein